jgi:hypothetical protein
MPNFRCHMLDEHGDILFPTAIIAETVSAAIRHAFEILESNNLSPCHCEKYARSKSGMAMDGLFPSHRRSPRN